MSIASGRFGAGILLLFVLIIMSASSLNNHYGRGIFFIFHRLFTYNVIH